MAAALGMHVIGIRAHPERGGGGADEVLGTDMLDAVIPRADFIVLAAPTTERTNRLIDARRLRLCKPGAYLVNVSRGSLVDEAALATALKQGAIAGAALDVFDQEPLRRWSPLWKMPQVLITPHIAALSERTWDRHYAVFVDNMRRYIAGEPLSNVVDKHRGY
jgi:phosphoglycerate dehydrogenase-like enzyme